MAISILQSESTGAKIKVVGVGGGGSNIVNSMVNKGIDGVEFISINTDAQALENSKADVKIQIGKMLTKGLGAGMKDDIGKKAVEENREEVARALNGSDMVFITAGMGGGTGTGAAPEIAHIAKSQNALVVSIVTKPFNFEGKPKKELAEKGLKRLKEESDCLIVIPNQKIMDLIKDNDSKQEAFSLANRVLYNATKGISQIITKHGEINVDFADVRTIMKDSGDAMIGSGIASGENRAMRAVQDALENPVLDNIDIAGARNVLVNISSNGQIGMKEIERINQTIHDIVGDEAKYIIGIVDDPELKDTVMVTVIATGFNYKEEVFETTPVAEIDEDMEEMEHSGVGSILIIPDNISDLDKPAIIRRHLSSIREEVKINPDLSEKNKAVSDSEKGFDDEYFDENRISNPAFLRKQMD